MRAMDADVLGTPWPFKHAGTTVTRVRSWCRGCNRERRLSVARYIVLCDLDAAPGSEWAVDWTCICGHPNVQPVKVAFVNRLFASGVLYVAWRSDGAREGPST